MSDSHIARMDVILALSGVGARRGGAIALNDIHLEVGGGEVVAILGRNGVGKSTLIETIAGMVPDCWGVRTYKGEDVSSLSAAPLALRGIRLVPQGRRIFTDLTVRENMAVARRNRSKSGGDEWGMDATLKLVPDLATRLNQLGGTLSGGQQQMLAIARAMVGEPSLLLMDEPFEGLAPAIVRDIHGVVSKLKRMGIPILIAEQRVDLLAELADRAVMLSKGSVVFSGSLEDVLTDRDLLVKYIGAKGRSK